MNSPQPTIFIVDDDASVRDSLALLLGLKGFRSQIFANAESLLTVFDPEWFGCMLVDVRMPGMSGLDLYAQLRERGCDLPVVIMTAYGDVATARAALKAGAADFLEKPIDDDILIDVLQSAIDALELQRHRLTPARDTGNPEPLTTREQQVLELADKGLPARKIAAILGISPRTVEVYKSRMVQKLRQRQSD